MGRRSERDLRMLVFAPEDDASFLAGELSHSGIAAVVCPGFEELSRSLQEGAGGAVIAQDCLPPGAVNRLAAWVSAQPDWSDLPLMVLTPREPRSDLDGTAQQLEALGNVTLLERPVRADTIRSAARAALRARKRQYEIKSSQEKLTRAHRDLEQFAHTASHDLQEPLRTVAIYSEILAERYRNSLDEDGLVLLGYLRSGAVRMEMLIRDLRSYTDTAAPEDTVPVTAEVAEHLHIVLSKLSESVQSNAAVITCGPLPAVSVSVSHLQQLLENFLSNSLKYRREEPPKIHVSAQREDGFWRFAVSDNGLGIEPQFQKLIFGVFKRLHSQDKFSGTGIGLAICQRITESYGGSIWVESEPGKGSTFFFTLPE